MALLGEKTLVPELAVEVQAGRGVGRCHGQSTECGTEEGCEPVSLSELRKASVSKTVTSAARQASGGSAERSGPLEPRAVRTKERGAQ